MLVAFVLAVNSAVGDAFDEVLWVGSVEGQLAESKQVNDDSDGPNVAFKQAFFAP